MKLDWMKNMAPNIDWPVEKIAASALFDVDFYLGKYPDVQCAGVDPFEHYCADGWREGRDPSARFSTSFYLRRYLDVAAAKLNPLFHYALEGSKEGRLALPLRPIGESGREIVLGADSARCRGAAWLPVDDIDVPLHIERLREILLAEFATSAHSVILSLSHDQYLKSVGGVQAAIAVEERTLTNAGWTYIHLCPAWPHPHLSDAEHNNEALLVLTMGGRREGVVRLSDLLMILPLVSSMHKRGLSLIVHHLMGFAVETVVKLSNICADSAPLVWVHDFFTLCSNPFLLRNNIAFCNAPPVQSSACMVCAEGADRQSHIDQIKYLFDVLRPVVLAPSETALDFWRIRGQLPYSTAMVLPLARVELGTRNVASESKKLRIAHLGAPASHKGWSTFRRLVERHSQDERYEFFRLGVGVTDLAGLTEVHVEVTPDDVDAMVEATRAHNIDVVINWSSCYETFSFITLEALAGGAFVVARKNAGNVWPAIAAADRERGLAVSTESELRALFLTGEIFGHAGRTLTRGRLIRSRGTSAIFLKEVLDV